ncbi:MULTISPECIES: D-glycero-beta-D-manno-heptose 1-phosphate adenylyltransferase [unclassified Brevundimonas]|uniref:D-glycero-beta-D-manno-heptose 1-phosphate adenylyltransferase n=1 Tax=unclassified Brevundimonas TaxID=2622653 RepID=UPI0025BDD59B|nr:MULTISPECIES: D-glycero-beta-D-manno-heptose 1-phosphate adenylyltransferase [unclassified Brevundimonas]
MAERSFDLAELQNLLERIKGIKVACVGDLMLDRFVYGEVSRISPEAPIPVLKTRRSVSMPGGVGNVARNIAALGATARLGAVAGSDAAGDELAALIADEARIEDVLSRPQDAGTIVKTRFVSSGQQLLRLDEEATSGASYSDPTVFEGCGAILLSDYAKGVVNDGVIALALEAAKSTGAPLIVDPKGTDFARYGSVDLIKPNASELSAATGLPVGTDEEVERALAALIDTTTVRAVVVTRAGKGMSMIQRGGKVVHFPGRAREVFDVSGAGDTALAALGLGLAAGLSLEQSVQFAILASGVVVGKAGTAVVTPRELIDAERTRGGRVSANDLYEVEALADQVARWQADGLKVGFTNGCFDILHRGHVAYLAQARGWCDRLVVALNTDASVSALKGPTRPVNNLDSRAAVIGALASVDAVTYFDQQTPLDLINRLRPNVLIKGSDYTKEQVVGAVEVESWGGEVRLASFEDGYSTTRTIEKMKSGSEKTA